MEHQSETQTVDSKSAIDYLDPTNEPEPSEETGLGTHFNSTFDPAMKKEAPQMPELPAKDKLAKTSSTMTTKQLQEAAAEGDPNNLLAGKLKNK